VFLDIKDPKFSLDTKIYIDPSKIPFRFGEIGQCFTITYADTYKDVQQMIEMLPTHAKEIEVIVETENKELFYSLVKDERGFYDLLDALKKKAKKFTLFGGAAQALKHHAKRNEQLMESLKSIATSNGFPNDIEEWFTNDCEIDSKMLEY